MPTMPRRRQQARRRFILTLWSCCLALLAACSAGAPPAGNAAAQGTAAVISNGVFIDAAVQGLSYASGGASGVTGADGGFHYVAGDTVRFAIGGITIGHAPGAALLTPLAVTGATDVSDPAVTNLVRFLLTLDDDGDPANGIQITANERALAGGVAAVRFDQSTTAFDSDGGVQSLVAQLTAATSAGARSLVPAAAAQSHLTATLQRYYAGQYSGTFTGIAASGSFAVTASPDGTVTGTAQFDQGGSSALIGSFSPAGAITFHTGTSGAGLLFDGTLTNARSMSGVWNDAVSGAAGSFFGNFKQPTATGGGAYTVGGTVSGLAGTVVLQDGGGDALAVSHNGAFTFPTALHGGDDYAVTIATQPASQTCSIDQGSGKVSGADITTVIVSCHTTPPATYRVGGTVTGLSGTLVLQINGGEEVGVSRDGAFTFSTPLPDGTSYQVTVATQPAGQTCTVSRAGGAVHGADVASIGVGCSTTAPATYTIGGTVSGLNATLGLQLNAGEQVTVTRDGAFHFPTPLQDGSAYHVTVATQPAGQTCGVSGADGTLGGSDVNSIRVTCSTLPPPTYTVGGTVTGLAGTLVLELNGGEQVTVTRDGAFHFPTPLQEGSAYHVTVATQPAGQTCGVSGADGTLGGSDINSVGVTCSTLPPPAYTVGGTVTGLAGTLVLQLNGGEQVTVTHDGAFTFPTPLADGATYHVAAATQPDGQQCNVAGTGGTVRGADVTSVAVSCATLPPLRYSIGGTVSGLSGALILSNNGETLPVAADGPFTFPTSLADGSAYAVGVAAQPAGQTCTVANASGVIRGADVQTVTVNCAFSGGIPTPYTIGGLVTGLNGGTLLLQNNSERLAIFRNGSFTFHTPVMDGADYSVSIVTEPAGTSCSISGASGTVTGADVSVSVTCQALLYTIGGTVTGLHGHLVLQDNGGDDLPLDGDGQFTFATPLAMGTPYSVTVAAQPDHQRCNVHGGSGVVGTTDVSTASVACVDDSRHGHGHGPH